MNVAIILTFSRLISAPLFVFFFLRAVSNGLYDIVQTDLWLAILFVALIELSDAFDGYFARSQKKVTRLGKIFDPVCDSISRLTIFCAFMVSNVIPMWLFLVFMYRDLLNTFLRVMCAIDGTVMAAKLSGKLKAIFQAIGTILILIVMLMHSYQYSIVPHVIFGHHPGFWIMLFPALFTVTSFFDYLIPTLPVIKKMMIPLPKDNN